MLKSRKMKDIHLKEVSLVDKPANLRPFLLFKRDGKSDIDSLLKVNKKINIEIESDGTKGGTKVTINGDAIDKMRSFNFSFWETEDDKSKVNCSYSKLIDAEDGFQRTETYYLAKGDSPMDERIKEVLKKLFGDKVTKFEKVELNEETITEIVKALTIIEEYKSEFPADLGAAIGLIAIHAGQGYKQPENVEKAGAKLSKETLAKIKAVVAALTSMLPKEANEDSKVNKTADDDNASEIEKTVKALSDSIAELSSKMDKKEASEQLEGIGKTLEQLTERLNIVEKKPASTKKSLNEQDGENEDGTETTKSADKKDKWPTLTKAVGETVEED